MFVFVPRMRSLGDVRAVFTLKAAGLTDREVSRRTGVPVNTIRAWRNRHAPLCARPCVLSGSYARNDTPPDLNSLPRDAYAYLLGMYLGDGCLTRNGSSWTLRVALDTAYPGIISECERAIAAVAPHRYVYTRAAWGGQN